MELEFKENEIIVGKELSMLDNFVLDFVNMFNTHKIRYVIISGYATYLFGGKSMSEDVDFLIQHTTFERFLRLWLEFEKEYDCLSANDITDVYNGFLVNYHAVRIAKKGRPFPNLRVRFMKNELDRFTMKYRRCVKLNNNILFISPLEIQIPYKLFLGSEKDIKDARFLFKLFKDKINMAMLDRFLNELGIPEESVEKYLGRS